VNRKKDDEWYIVYENTNSYDRFVAYRNKLCSRKTNSRIKMSEREKDSFRMQRNTESESNMNERRRIIFSDERNSLNTIHQHCFIAIMINENNSVYMANER
jgi:hypothetical protein